MPPTPKKRSMVPLVLLCLILVVLLFGVGWALLQKNAPIDPTNQNANTNQPAVALTAASLTNALLVIEGQDVQLSGGQATVQVAEGDTSVTETYTLDDAQIQVGDVNNDGKQDVVGIIHYNSSGTGVFTYVVAVLTNPAGVVTVASDGLGDRILVDDLKIEAGAIVVSYLDRRPDEAMAAMPTVPFTRRYRVIQDNTGMRLVGSLRQSACHGQNMAVQAPVPQSVITFPLTVSAVVDNTQNPNCMWTVFEAQAGVVSLVNLQNNVIASAVLMTAADWMTTAPVTYTATLQPGVLPANGPLTLIITEEDPSGMQVQEQVMVPVTY